MVKNDVERYLDFAKQQASLGDAEIALAVKVKEERQGRVFTDRSKAKVFAPLTKPISEILRKGLFSQDDKTGEFTPLLTRTPISNKPLSLADLPKDTVKTRVERLQQSLQNRPPLSKDATDVDMFGSVLQGAAEFVDYEFLGSKSDIGEGGGGSDRSTTSFGIPSWDSFNSMDLNLTTIMQGSSTLAEKIRSKIIENLGADPENVAELTTLELNDSLNMMSSYKEQIPATEEEFLREFMDLYENIEKMTNDGNPTDEILLQTSRAMLNLGLKAKTIDPDAIIESTDKMHKTLEIVNKQIEKESEEDKLGLSDLDEDNEEPGGASSSKPRLTEIELRSMFNKYMYDKKKGLTKVLHDAELSIVNELNENALNLVNKKKNASRQDKQDIADYAQKVVEENLETYNATVIVEDDPREEELPKYLKNRTFITTEEDFKLTQPQIARKKQTLDRIHTSLIKETDKKFDDYQKADQSLKTAELDRQYANLKKDVQNLIGKNLAELDKLSTAVASSSTTPSQKPYIDTLTPSQKTTVESLFKKVNTNGKEKKNFSQSTISKNRSLLNTGNIDKLYDLYNNDRYQRPKLTPEEDEIIQELITAQKKAGKGITTKQNFTVDLQALKKGLLKVKNNKTGSIVINKKVDASTIDIFSKPYYALKKYSPEALKNYEQVNKLMNKKDDLKLDKIKSKLSTPSVSVFTNPSDMLDKLELILGSMGVGNNSNMMKNEGRAILDELLKIDAITKVEHKELYKQLN